MTRQDDRRAPGGWPRRLLSWLLPLDDWTDEFLHQLDIRAADRRPSRLPSALWYAAQLARPSTWSFIFLMRRRRLGRDGGGGALSGVGMDVRYAVRSFAREPRAAAFIVAALAAGLGSVSAMYGVAERLFLAGPRHVAEAHELVRVFLSTEDAGGVRVSPWLPLRTAEAIQREARSFSGMTLYRRDRRLARIGPAVGPMEVSEVDGHYFTVMGAVPAAGRFFDPATAAEGGNGAPTVLSWAAAAAAFGSPGSAVGRAVELLGETYTVVGVAPEGFAGPHLDRVDVWVPVDRTLAEGRNWWLVGRIAEAERVAGSRVRATLEAQAIHDATDPGRFFGWAREGRVVVAPIGSDDGGAVPAEASIARLLMGVVVLLLTIAVANVVNLLLARLSRRRRELTVRLSLGAGRLRLLRLLAVESALLAFAGAAASLPVAYGVGLLLRRVLLPQVAWTSSPLDLRVLTCTALAAGVTTILIALLPARYANRVDIAAGMGRGRNPGAGRHRRVHGGLAMAQVALSAALLMGAGLFAKSFWTIRVTDLGIDAEEILVVELRSLDGPVAPSGSPHETRLYEDALAVARGMDPNGGAALAVGLPFISGYGWSIWVPGRDSIPQLPGGGPFVSAVGDNYFRTVGTSIVRGTELTREHVESGSPVVVVSASMAAALWPNSDPLGRCVHLMRQDAPCSNVVGVAEDVHRTGYREPPSMQFYVPIGASESISGTSLVVRPSGEVPGLAERLGADLVALDAGIDYVDTVRLDTVLESQIRPWRLGAVVLAVAGALAIFVAVLGVYGVLSYAVERRRTEIGVRMALGAERFGIGGLMLRSGLTAGAAGLLFGIGAVMLGGPWVEPLLFETSVADPLVLLAVTASLVACVGAACVLPALRASSVDPVACLRSEG